MRLYEAKPATPVSAPHPGASQRPARMLPSWLLTRFQQLCFKE